MTIQNFGERRVYQPPTFKREWNRRVAERRYHNDTFMRFITMPVPVFFRRTREELTKWYNAA